MAHNTRTFQPPVVFGQTISETEINKMDVEITESVNGDQGGTWAPATPIALGGAGVQVTGAFDASNVTSLALSSGGGLLSVPVGAQILVLGTQVVNAGGIVQWQAGAFLNVSAGATLAMSGTMNAGGTINASGTINMSGTVTLSGATQIQNSPARVYTRTAKGVLTFDGSLWGSAADFGAPMRLVMTSFITPGAVDDMVPYVLDLPDGATLTSVSVSVKGSAPAHLPTDRPTVHLYKLDLTTGTTTFVAAQVDASATAADYINNHDITISGLAEVVNAATTVYVVRIEGEGTTGGVLGLRICAPRGTFTRTRIGEE